MKRFTPFAACCGAALLLGGAFGMIRPTLTSSQTVGPSIGATGGCGRTDIYLEIPQLKLDDADHSSLEVRSVAYGFQNSTAFGSGTGGSGAGAGKATFEDLVIQRFVDVHSLQVFQYLVTQNHFADVIIEYKGTTSSGTSVTCATVDFKMVFAVKQAHTSQDEVPAETLNLIFGSAELKVYTNPTSAFVAHRLGNQVRFTWRLAHASQVAGFDLYAGQHRVNSHLIPVHPAATYHYSTRWSGHGAYSLHVLLTSGAHLVVPAQ
ncbi:MAG: type VI secretion system tube protein Hcp [Chloroflexota bacterium]|nr:type VI secretion system tube protein Hcp [Chloroflexota bacterium]